MKKDFFTFLFVLGLGVFLGYLIAHKTQYAAGFEQGYVSGMNHSHEMLVNKGENLREIEENGSWWEE